MFTPKAFKIDDLDKIMPFIAAHPLATVIVYTADGLDACHIPMYWQNDGSAWGCLYGHITKTNGLNHSNNLKAPWLFIFQNAGHYISPNWYPSKAATHKAVPTWNYQAVHVSGKVDILTDAATLIEILSQQTADFEASQPTPWSLNDAPEHYIAAMCRGIVGLRVNITDIQAQFKLSQNKTDADRKGVIAGLRGLGSANASAMAGLIESRNS